MRAEYIPLETVDQAAAAIASVGADDYSIGRMARKAFIVPVLISDIDNRAAGILKQETISCGGEAAVSRDVAAFTRGLSRVLVMATPAQYERLLPKLKRQPFGLPLAGEALTAALAAATVRRGKAPRVMGIVNVTPDSFSAGGIYHDPGAAVERALALIADGADIIDIGGESTRPGARPVPAAEELRRVVPVIRALRKKTACAISVDTCKPVVARAALAAGADIVNDITGLRSSGGAMAAVVARAKAGVVIMHMQGTPRTMQKAPHYRDIIADIYAFFEQRIAFAVHAGVRRDRIILDPGIGFGKTVAHNVELLRRLRAFEPLGFPVLVGASRKNFIGVLTGVDRPQERGAASVAAAVWAAGHGAAIVRVHDVRETCAALNITGELSAWK